MIEHELKTWPDPFVAILLGNKRHDVRTADRKFRAGDTVLLREYDIEHKRYTGRTVRALITYVSEPGSWGLPKTLCVFSFEVVEIDYDTIVKKGGSR